MTRILQSELARQDLLQVANYLSQESGSDEVAQRFLDDIARRSALYAEQPELGERCLDLGESIRRFVVGRYVVFYQAITNGIELLRVIHGNRDVPAVWRRRKPK